MEKEIIILKQAPVIVYDKLKEIGEQVSQRIEALDLNAQIITTDTLKQAKETRSELNKEFSAFEEQRKALKKAINEPYEIFERNYKEFIASNYTTADGVLKGKIDQFNNTLKEEKTQRVKGYFTEQKEVLGLDFLRFEQVGLNVTLTASDKSLMEKCDNFLKGVVLDIESIGSLNESQEAKAEILTDYQQSLNAMQAVSNFQYRQRAKEAHLERMKQAQPNKVQEQEPKQEVQEQQKTSEEKTPQRLYATTFKVRGTKEQLQALKQFIVTNNIEII